MTRRSFKKEQDERRKRIFQKSEGVEEETRKRNFKRVVTLTGLVDIDSGNSADSNTGSDLEAEKKVFFQYVEAEQEKLKEAKNVLQEVAVKLEEERKALSSAQEQFHYEKEELVAFKKKLEAQKDIQEAYEAERQNYEKEIARKNEEIAAVKQELLKIQGMLDESNKEKEHMKEVFERERQILLSSSQSQSAEDLQKQRSEIESAVLEKVKKEAEEKKESSDSGELQALKAQMEELTKALEEEKKSTRDIKSDLLQSKKDFVILQEQNKELNDKIATKDKKIHNIDKQVKKKVHRLHHSYENFFSRERKDFQLEKEKFEELKLKMAELENESTTTTEASSEIESESKKLEVIKKYIEEEHQRLILARKKFEEDQAAFIKDKKSILQVPKIKINIGETDSPELKAKTDKPPKSSRKTARQTNTHTPKRSEHNKERKKTKPRKNKTQRGTPSTPKEEQPATASTEKKVNNRASVWGIRPRLDSEAPRGESPWTSRRPRTPSSSMTGTHREEEKKKFLGTKKTISESEDASTNQDEKSDTSEDKFNISSSMVSDVGDVSGAGDDFDPVNDPLNVGDLDPFTVPPEKIARLLEASFEWVNPIMYSPEHEIKSANLVTLLFQFSTAEVSQTSLVIFFLTYDYFISAHTLLRYLVLLYRSPIVPVRNSSKSPEDLSQKFRVVNLLTFWITSRFSTLHHDATWVGIFKKFLEYLKADSPEFANSLNEEWEVEDNHYKEIQKQKDLLKIQTEKSGKPDIVFSSLSPKELAQQLTLVEQMYFTNVQYEEFYGKAWDYGEERAPNLSSLLERFGVMCYWVASEIVTASDENNQYSLQQRAKTISLFIQTMNELIQLKNYNSLMQINTGLNLPIVSFLKSTWDLVPQSDKDIMKKVSQMMDHTNNYITYRQSIETSEGAFIPFISLLLRDFTIIEEETNFLSGLKINFGKMGQLARNFAKLQDWQSKFFEFKENPNVQLYFHNKDVKLPAEIEDIANKIIQKEQMELTEQLGNELLGEMDKFEETPQMILKDALVTPEVCNKFHQWLQHENIEYANCIDCWRSMNDFKKEVFPNTSDGRQAKKELAAEIFNFYFPGEATKYVGEMDFQILQNLADVLVSENSVVKDDFFNKIIEVCYNKLDIAWQEFAELHHL
uniref:Ras-GEF domain-containing protein n=1 Tax=Arcella intermedia TaxID=1963864 RepID=A0A6B2KWM4_9EUKA